MIQIPFLISLPCLIGSFLIWLLSNHISSKKASIIACGGVIISFISSCVNFYTTVFLSKVNYIEFFTWINFFNGFSSKWSFYGDSITASMLIVVTFVSMLVHIYSIGYMSHDPHIKRFMSYLSLFTFFMIILVTSSDFLQLFVGWEGVGVSSYLLIGFWFTKESANSAAMKAFITNRVGDFALIIGLCTIYHIFGTLNFNDVFSQIPKYSELEFKFLGISVNYISFICLMLFIGCMGKSAQLGLHVWLPDAMEGPTPVSALIHAATMVTAGVFLIVRCSIMFEYAPTIKTLIVIVGSLTALFAASVAILQTDIKKIIAYSTCSQLGYMFFVCGLSGYTSAMFHLITHAFFKALLFLSAGSVIHAVSGEQEITKMGGLFKKIPLTFVCFLIGSLAIAGIFPFAGFFSKDSILETAFSSDMPYSKFAFYVGLFVAALTTLYSWRIITLVFHGSFRGSEKCKSHIHESPLIMTIPLLFLSVMSVISGYILEHFFSIINHESLFWNGSIFVLRPFHHDHISPLIKYMPMGISVFIILISYWIFIKTNIPFKIAKSIPFVISVLKNKYYFDEIYKIVFVLACNKISHLFARSDKIIVDNIFVGSLIFLSRIFSNFLKLAQNGFLTKYLLIIFTFISATFIYILFS